MKNLTAEEIVKLVLDPVHRFEMLYRIIDKAGNSVPFVLNPIQKKLLKSQSRRLLILKARQTGISTFFLIRALDRCIFNENNAAAIIAANSDQMKSLFRIVRNAYDRMPEGIKPELEHHGSGSQFELRFKNGSRIFTDLSTRGMTINDLHVSEAAFADPDRILGSMESVPLGGFIAQETTPNGLNSFFNLYNAKDDLWERLFHPWFLQSEYQLESRPLEFTDEEKEFIAYAKEKHGAEITHSQIAWRRAKKLQLKAAFDAEYPESAHTCFIRSGASAVNLERVGELLRDAPDPIEESDELKIYEHVKQGATYVLGVDPASGGAGSDFCVSVVFEAETRKQVAVLRGRFRPSDFARMIVELAERYKTQTMPMIACERNGLGLAVLNELNEHLSYPNLYWGPDKKLGWLTNLTTRPVALNTLFEAIEDNTVTLVDRDTLGELLTLTEKDGRVEAESGCHDDLVMASAIGLQICIQQGGSASFWTGDGFKNWVELSKRWYGVDYDSRDIPILYGPR